MITEQAKHFLLAMDLKNVIEWYNDSIEPYEDYRYCGVYDLKNDNLNDCVWSHLKLEALVALFTNPRTYICECDKYILVTMDYVVSFNTLAELGQRGDALDDMANWFLADEEENIKHFINEMLNDEN